MVKGFFNISLMLIGELSRKSGFSRDTIRYYEKLGLIESNKKPRSSYRDYGDVCLLILTFVRNTKSLGFTLAEIKEMVRSFFSKTYSCEASKGVISAKLETLDQEIGKLNTHKKNLLSLFTICDTESVTARCRAFEKLWGD